MSEYSDNFIQHLGKLQDNLGAMAALRHSLAFNPGAYPPAYPFVERFVRQDAHARDASRLALYIVASLFALHPQKSSPSLAGGLGSLMRVRKSDSIEKRFIALLGADPENLPNYLRQSVSLLAADGKGLNYSQLLDDISVWMNPVAELEWRDDIRQRWARDFYQTIQKIAKPSSKAKPVY